jgi:hypothetical protein
LRVRAEPVASAFVRGSRAIDRLEARSSLTEVAEPPFGLASRVIGVVAGRTQLGDGHVEMKLQFVVDGASDAARAAVESHEATEAGEAHSGDGSG